MPDNALPAPAVDLAALIPAQRVAGSAVPVRRAASPGRLALVWTLVGALAGSALVAVGFVVLLTLLP